MNMTTSLIDVLDEKLASEELQLPVFPPLALHLQRMLSADEVDIDRVAAKINEDQALASQLLRCANSAFFSGLSKVSTIKDSIMRLGTRQVTNVILMATQHRQYGSHDKIIQPYLASLWKHASCCANGSDWLAQRLGYRAIAQEAFLAGLLHDIGNLFVLKVLEEVRATTKQDLDLSKTVLNEILQNMHTTHGAKLMQSWNLPVEYCDVVRMHHDETFDSNNKLLAIVRLVNQACHKLGIGLQQNPSITLAATHEAQVLEVSELLSAELEILLEDTAASPDGVVI